MSRGIDFWPGSDGAGGAGFGAERTAWHIFRMPESGTGDGNWFPAKTGFQQTVPSFQMNVGAAPSQALFYSALDGLVVARGNPNSIRYTCDFYGLTSAAYMGRWDVPTGVPYGAPARVQVIREVMRWTQNTTVDPITSTVHGFYLGTATGLNAGYGTRVLNGTAFRGFGLVYRADLGSFFAFRKSGTLAVYDPISGVDFTAYNLIEHRLYSPSATEVGRYELWINQSRIVRYLATLSDFPLPTGNGQLYRPALECKDNYGGLAGGMLLKHSEMFTGPDSENVLAYAP